jgi:hypothetical protein
MMASSLHDRGLDLAPAIGIAASAEFQTFVQMYHTLPDLTPIFEGNGSNIPFPIEPSARYATAIGLTVHAADAHRAYHAFRWLSQVATAEWVQLFVSDLLSLMRSRGELGVLAALIEKDPSIQKFLQDYRQLVSL